MNPPIFTLTTKLSSSLSFPRLAIVAYWSNLVLASGVPSEGLGKTVYSVKLTVDSVQCTVQCAVYILQFTVYSVSIQCAV